MAKAKLFRGTIKGTAYWAHIKETEKYQNTDYFGEKKYESCIYYEADERKITI